MKRNLVVAITGASGAVYAVRLLDVLVAAGCDVQLSISPAGAAVLRQELGLEVNLDEFRLDSLLPARKDLATLDRFKALRTLIGVDAWQTGAPAGSAVSSDSVSSAHLQTPLPLRGEVGRGVKGSEPLDPPLAPPWQGGGLETRSTVPGMAASNVEPGRVRYHHHQDLFAAIASGSALTDGMVVCPCSGGTLSAIAHGASGNLIQRAADVHLKERRRLILVPRETPLSLVHLDNMRRAVEAGAVVLPAMPGFYQGVETVRDLVDFVVSRICDQLGVPQSLTRRWGDS